MLHDAGSFIRYSILSPVLPLSTQLLLPVILWEIGIAFLVALFIGTKKDFIAGGATMLVLGAVLSGLMIGIFR